MAEQNTAGGTILVVDDNPEFLHLMELMLKHAGYRPLLAQNAMAAMDLLEAHTPQAILLDIMMPVRSGFEFLENLRWDTRYGKIPVVVITAMTLGAEEKEFLADFATAWLDKADSHEVVPLLGRLLSAE